MKNYLLKIYFIFGLVFLQINHVIAWMLPNSNSNSNIDITLTQTIQNKSPKVGDTLTIQLTLINQGSKVAQNIKIQNILPPQLSLKSITATIGNYTIKNDTITWNTPILANISPQYLYIKTTINSSGLFFNTAEVIAIQEPDEDSTPNNQNIYEDDYSIAAISLPYIFCPNEEIALQLSAPTYFQNYQWYKNNIPIPNATKRDYTITQVGEYTLKVFDANSPTKCITIIPIPIIVQYSPLITVNFTNIIQPNCSKNNGQLTIISTNPNNLFSKDSLIYTSKSTFENLNVGKHTFYLKDINNCVFSNTITLTTRPDSTRIPLITTNKNQICPGEYAILQATNCPNEIVWNNGQTSTSINVYQSGIYTAKCKDVCGTGPSSQNIIIQTIPLSSKPIITSNTSLLTCDSLLVTLIATNCNAKLIWNTGATTKAISITQNGTYTATCQNICSKTNTSIDIPIPQPRTQTPSISTNTYTLCNAQTATLIATGCDGTITWNTGNTGNSLITNKNGTYWATCTNTCGTGKNSNQIIINQSTIQLNQPQIQYTKNYICASTDTIKLTATNCSQTIIWSNGATGNTIKINTPGKYTATCTNFCVQSLPAPTVEITQAIIPQKPQLSASVNTICPGQEIILTASGCQPNQLIWKNTGQTTNSILVKPMITTTFEASCQAQCQSSLAQIVINTTKSIDTLKITGPTQPICPNSKISLSAIGCKSNKVIWSNGATGSTITLTVPQTTKYTAVCQDTLAAKCDFLPGTITLKASIPQPNTEATYQYALTDTLGKIIALTNTPTFTNTIKGIYSAFAIAYTSPISGLIIGANINNIQSNCFATTKLSISVCPNSQCNPTGSIQITTISEPKIATQATTQNLCKNQAVTLSVTQCTHSIQWSSGQTTQSISINQPGAYYATCTNQCSTIKSNIITINHTTKPPKLFSTGVEICPNDSVKILATQCNGKINWSNGTSANPIVIKTAGKYTATCTDTCGTSIPADTLTIINRNNCKPTCNNLPPTISANKITICTSDSLILTASNCPAQKVLWSTGQTGNTIMVQPKLTATYFAVCIRTDTCISIISNQLTINLIDKLKPQIKYPLSFACIGQKITLTAEGCGNAAPIWSTGNTTNSITVTADPKTYYILKCKEQTCESTPSDTLYIPIGKPIAPFIYTRQSNSCFGQKAQLVAQGCQGIVHWSNGATGEILTVQPSQPKTTYTAFCQSINADCKSNNSNAITISVSPQIPKPLTIKNLKNICPLTTVDLNNAILSNLSATNNKFEFHLNPDPNSLLLTNPTMAEQGTYYLFERDVAGCYSDYATIQVDTIKCSNSISPTTPKVDIAVYKSASVANAQVGDNIYFKIVVKNLSQNKATHILIRDILPNELVLLADNTPTNSQAIQIKIDSLTANDSLIYTYKTKVISGGKIINRAELYKLDQIDSLTTNNASEVIINKYPNYIGISKTASKPLLLKPNVFRVDFTIYITNQTDKKQNNIQIFDNLSDAFGNGVKILNDTITLYADAGLKPNPNFTGRGTQTNLLLDSASSIESSKTLKLKFSVSLDVSEAMASQFFNVAYLKTNGLTDQSTNDTNPDPDNDYNPQNNQEPTPIYFEITPNNTPKVALALSVADTNKLGSNTYEITYMIIVKNYSNLKLTNVLITDTLANTFNDSVSYLIVNKVVASNNTTLKLNPNYNGKNDTQLTLPEETSILNPNQQDTLVFTIKLFTNGHYGKFSNNAYVRVLNNQSVISDTSNDGPIIQPAESTPTIININKPPSGELIIPQAFSPNQDGKNDTFIIKLPLDTRLLTCHIYNRWGSLVYIDTTAEVTQKGWTGVANNGIRLDKNNLPDGTYFYVLKLDTQPEPIIGFVELAR